jgi:membrane protein
VLQNGFIIRSTSEMINVSVDMVRGLTWSEVRDLVRFARRRLREESCRRWRAA